MAEHMDSELVAERRGAALLLLGSAAPNWRARGTPTGARRGGATASAARRHQLLGAAS